MNIPKVDSSKCPQDHACPLIQVCPVGAISQEEFSAPKIDPRKCISCGKCTLSCPYQVLFFE